MSWKVEPMTEFLGTDVPLLVDTYSGFPVASRPTYGPQRGTVEWLLEAIERHATAEEGALEQYEHLATASGDPVIEMVMRLILEDEARHHGLLKRIEASLRDALEWTHSRNALPASGTPQTPAAGELQQTAHLLINEERTGARYLRDLARQEKRVDAGLHGLLLEMMATDSEKHASLLQFVCDRLAARARAEDGPSD